MTTGTDIGTDATTLDTTSTDGTENSDSTTTQTAVNDPVKNRKTAYITMAENTRKLMDFTVKFPGTVKGLHTNMFCWIPVDDDFYDDFFGDIASVLGNTKFARYAGFEKGRFYIEGVKTSFSVDEGINTELTLNPFASGYSEYMKMQQEAEQALESALSDNGSGSSSSSGTGAGLTTMSGKDCTETFGIATRGYDVNASSKNKIGNSSANYATDTANMDGKSALLDIFKRFSYSNYPNNRTCPQKMWNKGTIHGNCADISRLCMCVGQVHGLNIGIHHMSGHYYNLIEVNGKTYRFDCCFKSGRSYRGEVTNTLNMRGGPWS